MPFDDDIDQDLAKTITTKYQQAPFWGKFSDVQLKAVFSEAELADLKKFLDEMKAATDDNDKKAEAITKFTDLVGKVLKFAKVVP